MIRATGAIYVALFLFSAMTPAAEPAGGFSGRVIDSTGSGAAGAEVTLHIRHLGRWERYRAAADRDGRFVIPELLEGRGSLFARTSDGRVGMASVAHVAGPVAGETTITLTEPKSLRVRVSDPEGRPLSGAYAHSIEMTSPDGTIFFRQALIEAVGIEWPRSDEDGLLEVGGLPANSLMTVEVAHPSFVRSDPIEVPPDATDPPAVRLSRGGRLLVRLRGSGVEVPLTGLKLDLFGDRSYFVDEPLVPDDNGRCEMTAPPGTWSGIVRGTGVQTLPAAFENVVVTDETPGEVKIDLILRGVVRGQIVDAVTGKAVAGTVVSAATYSASHATDPYGYGVGWHFSAHAVTDSDGRYEITPGVGPARLWVRSPGRTAEPAKIEVEVPNDVPVEALPFRLQQKPRLVGSVVDPKGHPVPHAVLKPTGQQQYTPAAIADANGRFDFAVEGFDQPNAGKSSGTLTLHVFDPLRPLETKTTVPAEVGKTTAALMVRLAEVAVPPPPGPESRTPQYISVALGEAAPSLLGRKVLNGHGPLRLEDFEGKYVLLDFWTVWCGPCRRQKPEVEAAARLYSDRLVVIGVHDNCVPSDKVAADVAEHGPSFPTLIDTADNATTRRYGVEAYPTFVLIGPDGRVLITSGHNGPAMWGDLLSTLRSFLYGPPRREPVEASRS